MTEPRPDYSPDSRPDDDSPLEEFVDDVVADDAAATSKRHLGPLGITVAIVFGVFYAYTLFAGISQAIDLPRAFTEAGVDGVPVLATVLGVVIPIVAFPLALFLGLRRNAGEKALVYLAGLVAVVALSFTLIGIENAALAEAIAAR